MEVIYIIALEITIILGILSFFPFSFGILSSLILIFGIYIFNRKNIFLFIIPLIFLIQAFFTFNHEIKIGDIKTFQISLYEGRGKIEKIDNRYPLTNSYLYLSNKSDGEYEVIGKVEDIKSKYGNNYYEVEMKNISSLPQNRISKYFQEKSDKLLQNSSYDMKRVYKAVILGEGYRLTKKMRDKFNYIGISHLMALSGFHIGVVISLISMLLSKKLPLKKREKNIFLLMSLTIYYLGIKHSPSLDRAYFMGVICLLGKILDENTELFKSLIVSYILSLIINPASINSISFQLSYGAVFIIAGVFQKIKTKIYHGKSKIVELIFLTLSIQIFLAPLLIREFGTVQLFSFITNLVVVPVGTLFISLGFIGLLLENLSLGFLIIPILNFIFKIFSILLDFFYNLPFMSIKYQSDSPFITIFYLIFIIGVFIFKFRKDYKKNEKIYKRTKISQ